MSLFLLFFNFSIASKNLGYFVRPSQLAINYILISFLFGSLLFHFEIVYWTDYIRAAENWNGANFGFWTASIALSILISKKFNTRKQALNLKDYHIPIIFLVFGLVSFVIFTTTGVYFFYFLGFLFSSTFILSKKSYLMIFLLFVIISIILAEIAINNKRLIIFFIISILLVMNYEKKLNAKMVFYVVFYAIVLLFMVVLFSIGRGYGNYEYKTLAELLFFVPHYLSSDNFLLYLGNNLEVNYFYFHGVNAVQLVLDGLIELAGGSTILNGILLGWGRTGIDLPIESSIDIYTRAFAYDVRIDGGSFPPNLFAELFINFHFASIILIPISLFLFDRLFLWIMAGRLTGITIYAPLYLFNFLVLCRGSSFDLFTLYSIYGLVAWILYVIIKNILSKKYIK